MPDPISPTDWTGIRLYGGGGGGDESKLTFGEI